MNGDRSAPGRRAVLFVILGLAVGAGVRYGVIQPPELGWACQVATPPWWCLPRQGLIAALQMGALGWMALAAGIAAVFGGGRRVSMLASGFGAAALLLYGAGAGAVALLLGMLRALRL